MFAALLRKPMWKPAVAVGALYSMWWLNPNREARASGGHDLKALKYKWSHTYPWESFDTASVRRGYEVYRQVCSTCHSLKFLSFRHLVGVTHTAEQAKTIAGSFTVEDGPDDLGEMFERPMGLNDRLPKPYPNDEFARYVNNGSLPPDLSLIECARDEEEDYVFSLLTGYRDPPAGVKLLPGLHYNPYFAGGAIGMAPMLFDEVVAYEDDTPQTPSQYAKDVACFLKWAGEPESDERKRVGMKVLTLMVLLWPALGYWKRFVWSVPKNRRISYIDRPGATIPRRHL